MTARRGGIVAVAHELRSAAKGFNMGTLTTLTGNSDCALWKRTSTDTLIRLRAALNPDSADEVADAQYVASKELNRSWLPRNGQRVYGELQSAFFVWDP